MPHRRFGGLLTNTAIDRASSLPIQPLQPKKRCHLQSPFEVFGPRPQMRPHVQSENHLEEVIRELHQALTEQTMILSSILEVL